MLSILLATVLSIDAAADRHRINPHVYGVNFATQTQLLDLNVPLNRSGGNAATRYNWQQNCSSRAHDWFYESLEDGPAVAGEEVDTFITATKAGSAEPMITMPIIGWVAKLGPNRQRLCSFSIAKYGAQQRNDWEWFPDAGNGVYPNGTPITGNDPHDANMPVDSNFMRGWMQHLVAKWGNASNGGVRWYLLDNEHSIWHSTHRDVKPTAPTMDEILLRMTDYAEMIKSVDPNALVAGPEEWGWSAYFLSGYDQQWSAQRQQWSNTPDRVAHQGWDYMPWLLARFRHLELQKQRRLLDMFTLHYYPQGGEYSNTVTEAMQLRRNRSTRSLWDPNYTDETWINDRVRLVPRMKQWVDEQHPGIPIGLTEYSWGADAHINGATAQADVLGILGREGMDLATRWVTPATNTPSYNAIKMYRNYDGNKSAFGDISVRALAPNPDNVAVFASLRSSDRALTIVIVNKQLATSEEITLSLANFSATGVAQRYQLTSSNAITRLADQNVASAFTVPAQSITMLVVPGGPNDVTAPNVTITSATLANGKWTFTGTASDASAISGVTYRVSGRNPVTGTATGTTSWTVGPIAIGTGTPVVTFTAIDAAGNRGTAARDLGRTVIGSSPRRRAVGKP